MLEIREDDVDLHNPVQSRAGGCQHMCHVAQILADLIDNRPEVAPAGDGIDRSHLRKEDVFADSKLAPKINVRRCGAWSSPDCGSLPRSPPQPDRLPGGPAAVHKASDIALDRRARAHTTATMTAMLERNQVMLPHSSSPRIDPPA
jgi:hypothetical protein